MASGSQDAVFTLLVPYFSTEGEDSTIGRPEDRFAKTNAQERGLAVRLEVKRVTCTKAHLVSPENRGRGVEAAEEDLEKGIAGRKMAGLSLSSVATSVQTVRKPKA